MIPLLDPNAAGHVGAWLATYLVHGTVLFVVAWMGAFFVKSARIREQLWRAALFGPLLTASFQLGAGVSPLGGRFDIALANAPRVEAPAPMPTLTPNQALALARELESRGNVALGVPLRADAEPAATVVPRDRWTIVAALLVALGIAALMVRALLETLRVQRLGRGVVLTRGPIHDATKAFARRAGILRPVRIEVTERGHSPYATGVLRPRIVVPERAMAELDDAAIRAMIAHELGHIARFDPLWAAAIRSVTALFFFQPLNWIVARRLDECSEFCCDEFAVTATGDEVALARCLTSVADWIVGPQGPRPACAMAHGRSPLGQRVERILATNGVAARRHVGARALGAMALGATAFAAPGFATIQQAGAAPPTPPLPAALEVVAAHSMASPLSAIAADLEISLAELDAEIAELIALGARRELEPTTALRLNSLLSRAARLRAAVSRFTELAEAPTGR
ncbi:MAG: M56 family metallopeptidase [Planctomycetota bacterium]